MVGEFAGASTISSSSLIAVGESQGSASEDVGKEGCIEVVDPHKRRRVMELRI
ncbi:hypothetical protein ACLOJK_003904, partial [Asimina triloba]